MSIRIIKSIHRDTRKVVFKQQSGLLDDMFFVEASLNTVQVSEWYTAGQYAKAEARYDELEKALRNEDQDTNI